MSPPSAALLPHEAPMHWIQSVSVSADGNHARATAHIAPTHSFVRDGFLLPSALIELLAQAAAAGRGATAQRDANGRVRQGVLAAIQEFQVHAPVPADSTLMLSATHEKSYGPLTQARIEAHLGATLVASARMTFHLAPAVLPPTAPAGKMPSSATERPA
jgi:predicted hotdog family 3-hydroxylacyl-ACP dehydratase